MTAQQAAYPSLAWVIVPILLVPLGFFVRSRLAARKLARTGIGRGAPGFQTSVRRIAVTPEIAARLRAGEHVPPEEIAAAQEAAAASGTISAAKDKEKSQPSDAAEEENVWLPEELKKTNKGDLKVRKGKKRR
ncbi:hypothetical protein K439DRAFT_1363564 [Ramaria rubella]|nr:hypothetical protein K439DRAFT_1363564 [Ramaria rubella]